MSGVHQDDAQVQASDEHVCQQAAGIRGALQAL